MSRSTTKIPRWIPVDMQRLMSVQATMQSNETFGAFCRKAIFDFCSGCVSNDVDPIVKERYEYAFSRMLQRQEINRNNYQLRKYGHTSNTEDATTREDVENCDNTGNRAVLESATSSSILRGQDNTLATTETPCSEAATTRPRKAINDSENDQVTRQHSESHAEAPRSASPDSVSGNATDEISTASFVAIVDAGHCKSGKSGDVADAKKPYGEFRHVMLSDDEGRHLREIYGEDLKIAIAVLDGYIENGGKMAKKYKNHASVMRKYNWVWKEVQSIKLSEKRLDNAQKNHISFAEMERQRTARALRGESIDGRITIKDEDMTEEELEAVYGRPCSGRC